MSPHRQRKRFDRSPQPFSWNHPSTEGKRVQALAPALLRGSASASILLARLDEAPQDFLTSNNWLGWLCERRQRFPDLRRVLVDCVRDVYTVGAPPGRRASLHRALEWLRDQGNLAGTDRAGVAYILPDGNRNPHREALRALFFITPGLSAWPSAEGAVGPFLRMALQGSPTPAVPGPFVRAYQQVPLLLPSPDDPSEGDGA